MRIAKVASLVVVSLASLIVIATALIGLYFFASPRSGNHQNFAPTEGKTAVSPEGHSILLSQGHDGSSFLYRKNLPNGTAVRLTSALNGIESEASFSHNGKLVVYSFAASPESKSAVWLVGTDGQDSHAITADNQDALHPIFSPDDSKVFFAVSTFAGNYSPIVRPSRHAWDVFSIPIQGKAAGPNLVATQITHASFYDLQSLDIAADGITPGATKLLISTTGYPIGALIEEFVLGDTGRDKLFQPRVPGESSTGPSYGGARFIHRGMDVVFLAASNKPNEDYDYNVFSMSDVTGSNIKQLTKLKGMTKDLEVLANGKAAFVNGGIHYVLDPETQVVNPL